MNIKSKKLGQNTSLKVENLTGEETKEYLLALEKVPNLDSAERAHVKLIYQLKQHQQLKYWSKIRVKLQKKEMDIKELTLKEAQNYYAVLLSKFSDVDKLQFGKVSLRIRELRVKLMKNMFNVKMVDKFTAELARMSIEQLKYNLSTVPNLHEFEIGITASYKKLSQSIKDQSNMQKKRMLSKEQLAVGEETRSRVNTNQITLESMNLKELYDYLEILQQLSNISKAEKGYVSWIIRIKEIQQLKQWSKIRIKTKRNEMNIEDLTFEEVQSYCWALQKLANVPEAEIKLAAEIRDKKKYGKTKQSCKNKETRVSFSAMLYSCLKLPFMYLKPNAHFVNQFQPQQEPLNLFQSESQNKERKGVLPGNQRAKKKQ